MRGVVLAFALLLAAPASADVLVSNINQTATLSTVLNNTAVAQQFTTGSNATGYSLTSIEVKFGTVPNSTVRVRLLVGDHDGSAHATLTTPASLAVGNITFTAPSTGTTLAASTTYTVIVDSATSGALSEASTDAEDSGGAPGWSIADGSHQSSSGGAWTASASEMLIRVHGHADTSCSDTDTAVRWATGTLTDLAQDCTTLLNLKDTLRGTASLNWSRTVQMNQWNGLTGSDSIAGTPPRVQALRLHDNQLSGTIPPALGDLANLQVLYLHNNKLSGPIPAGTDGMSNPTGLARLTSLTHLSLHNNQLSGPIPPALGNLTSLTQLYLNNNQLSGPIPSTLGNLTSLTSLELYDNQLSGAIPAGTDGSNPTGLARLTNLTQLHLHNNRLSGAIPPALGNLTNLLWLFLQNNRLSGAIPAGTDGSNPTGLAKLTSLTFLDLNNNRLSGAIPPALGNLTSLTKLYLHNNRLSGAIPAGTDGGNPTGLANLTSLTSLYLNNNRLSGAIPPALGSLTNLEVLRLHNNQLRGTIPTFPASLIHLYLNDNQLDGTIPTLPASLTELYLNDNKLSGTIPTLPTNLYWLELQNNALTGNLDNLNSGNFSALYLHNNQLSGAVPAFSSSTGTFRLSLYGNTGLYGYNTALNTKTLLRLLAPGTGAAVCLYGDADGPAGTTDCTVPTKVDKLRVQASPTQLVFTWAPNPADPAPSGYAAQYFDPAVSSFGDWVDAPVTGTIAAPKATISGLTPGETYAFLVWTTATETATPPTPHPAQTTPRLYYVVTLPERSSGGRGGGGGGVSSRDDHGNSAARATPLAFRAATPRWGYTTGRINTRRDVDYFRLRLAQAGVLVLQTNGLIATQGTVRQDGVALASGGSRSNFRLSTRVAAGEVVIALEGNGRQTGNYILQAALVAGYLGNPAPASVQSGVGVISGWVCEAEGVAIEIVQENGEVVTLEAAYGTDRLDTATLPSGDELCGDTDNGFGLLVNWNEFGAGEHAVVALVDGVPIGRRSTVDGIELGRATVTVTTLGEAFLRDVAGECTVTDFPGEGETVRLVWQEGQQNFVLAGERAPRGAHRAGALDRGFLGNPGANSFQSGIGVISGWVCEAEAVEIEITAADGTVHRLEAAYGTERADTETTPDGEALCGDTDNGFGLLVNWNEFGAGEHTVVALVDGEELGRAVVQVTVLDAEEPFVRGLVGECVVEDFPGEGETVTLEWQQTQQNFVITGVD